MGCKMPWWAGSETPPPDKDKIISDLRAEVASLKEERDVFEAQRDAWKARSERRVDDIRELVARHERELSTLKEQNAMLTVQVQEALTRMDRARNLLTDGNPRLHCNWGMLDTSDIKAALAQQVKSEDARDDKYCQCDEPLDFVRSCGNCGKRFAPYYAISAQEPKG